MVIWHPPDLKTHERPQKLNRGGIRYDCASLGTKLMRIRSSQVTPSREDIDRIVQQGASAEDEKAFLSCCAD